MEIEVNDIVKDRDTKRIGVVKEKSGVWLCVQFDDGPLGTQLFHPKEVILLSNVRVYSGADGFYWGKFTFPQSLRLKNSLERIGMKCTVVEDVA